MASRVSIGQTPSVHCSPRASQACPQSCPTTVMIQEILRFCRAARVSFCWRCVPPPSASSPRPMSFSPMLTIVGAALVSAGSIASAMSMVRMSLLKVVKREPQGNSERLVEPHLRFPRDRRRSPAAPCAGRSCMVSSGDAQPCMMGLWWTDSSRSSRLLAAWLQVDSR
jgi:hypothetical protein